MKRFVLCAGLLLGFGSTWAADSQAGFVRLSPSGEARFYFGHELDPRHPVFFQTPGSGGAIYCCRKVLPLNLKRVEPGDDNVIDVSDPDQRTAAVYVLTAKAMKRPPRDGFLGVAMAARRAVAAGEHGLRSKGRVPPTEARICYGTEGANLIARTGEGFRVLYMGFGYSIEQTPACNSRDLAIIKKQG